MDISAEKSSEPPESGPSGRDSISVYELSSYDEAKPHWDELNRTYKGGELTFDWEAHRLIWDRFYKNRGAVLKILAGFEGSRCAAIFPLIWLDSDPLDPPRWVLTDDFIIAREYFCPPEKIHRFIGYLPAHYSDDLSCFYVPSETSGFTQVPGGVVDLKGSLEEYLQSLKKKARHSLRRTLAANADLKIEADTRVRWDAIQNILGYQLDYWMKKNIVVSSAYVEYSRDKILTDLSLMARAEEMGRLISHYFSLNGQLVAANFAVRRDRDRVDDYLCLRDCREEAAWRGLGNFAILTNMDFCRREGIRYYDLSACLKDYKMKFINMDSRYFRLDYPGLEAGNPAVETERSGGPEEGETLRRAGAGG